MHRKLYIIVAATFLCIFSFGCKESKISEVIPDSPTALTTLESTVLPTTVPVFPPQILPNEVAKYASNGYGKWYLGGGIPFQKRLDLMPNTYNGSGVTKSSNLLHFFTMSDIHITDVQSPAQTIFYGLQINGNVSGYSPVIPYTTRILDAAIQTVNALHKKNTIDFGLILGDAINNAQYNELRWYIGILDGNSIKPNSDLRLTIPASSLSTFNATGLDKAIPWYQVLGNHDHFWSGVITPNEYLKETLIGENILNVGDFTKGGTIDDRGLYMGVIDGSSEYGQVVGAGPVANFTVAPKVTANPERRYISKTAWLNEFFTSNSKPIGHGFVQNSGSACYTFEPKVGLPLKVIVLDDTQNEDCTPMKGAYASLDQERYNWLLGELDKGQSDGKLMIIAAHIPIGVLSYMFDPASIVSQTALIAKLQTYPNLILWLSGHRHLNTVTAFPSTDLNHPEYGFWEVETASLRNFPQQFRLFDIVRNTDNTISVFTTNVDPAVSEGSRAWFSRSYSIAAFQIFPAQNQPNLPSGAYNAELVKQLTPEMQAILQKY